MRYWLRTHILQPLVLLDVTLNPLQWPVFGDLPRKALLESGRLIQVEEDTNPGIVLDSDVI